MEHVKNLYKDSENLDVIVRGTVTGKSVNSADEVLYQIETPCGDCFEADERCVFEDVTKPVEAPQCVIDWYEDNKDNLDYNLWNYIMDWEEQEPSDFHNWFNASSQAFQTIVNMKQFGYKLKEEKKYLVRMKGVSDNSCVLKFYEDDNKWIMGTTIHFNEARIYHTKYQLKDGGFGDVFGNPIFEVKEVVE